RGRGGMLGRCHGYGVDHCDRCPPHSDLRRLGSVKVVTAGKTQDQPTATHMAIRDLTMAYGSFVIQRDLTFTIGRGDIFIIMGSSGCGKSTLLKHLIGLKAPA